MKLKVTTHSGEEFIVHKENYNAKELEEKINSNEVLVINIGGIVFSRIDIKLVQPIEEESK